MRPTLCSHVARSFHCVSLSLSDCPKFRDRRTSASFTGPVNLGNPNEFTIRQLAEKVIAMTGSKSELVQKPPPGNDPTQRQPDITVARTNLGWEPDIQLEQGLVQTIGYFQQLLAYD
jgi:UDP-glucuronate decarboxylase